MKIRMNVKSYVISVSCGTGCYRHIQIAGNKTLADLSDSILEAFDFDNDHQHAFFMNNRAWDQENSYFSYNEDGDTTTDQVKLQFTGLEVDKKFLYLFDFGDEWHFQCKVLKVLNEDTGSAKVIRTHGDAPDQYPDFSDDDFFDIDSDDFDDDDYDNDFEEPEELPVPVPDEVYDAAIRLRDTLLWKKLDHSDIFAIRLSNGEDGYCMLSSSDDDNENMMYFYYGNKGILSFYRFIHFLDSDNDSDEFEAMITQNCLEIYYEQKSEHNIAQLNSLNAYADKKGICLNETKCYPIFRRQVPYLIEHDILDNSEYGILREAIEASLHVSKMLKKTSKTKLGFTQNIKIPYLIPKADSYDWETIELATEFEPAYPTPATNKKTVSALKKLKKKGTMKCTIVYPKMPLQDSPNELPYFEALLLVVFSDTSLSLPVISARDYNKEAGDILEAFADSLLELNTVPESIWVSDLRTLSLLSSLCNELGIKLTIVDSLDDIEKLYTYLSEKTNERYNESFKPDIEEINEANEMIKALSLKDLRTMPKSLQKNVIRFIEEGIFEPSVEAKLKRAFNIK